MLTKLTPYSEDKDSLEQVTAMLSPLQVIQYLALKILISRQG